MGTSTFTVASGLGMLFVGIIAIFIIGSVGLYIINRLPKDEQDDR
tara:strand:- start:1283 stop:1417 length:135 start_codon:yes stop_codon:yes gene_type:complete